MKRLGLVVIYVALFALVAHLAFASIEGAKAEMKFADQIQQIKALLVRQVGDLTSMRDKAQATVTNQGQYLTTEDKAKLPDLKTKVNTAIADLNNTLTYINTNWSNIE